MYAQLKKNTLTNLRSLVSFLGGFKVDLKAANGFLFSMAGATFLVGSRFASVAVAAAAGCSKDSQPKSGRPPTGQVL